MAFSPETYAILLKKNKAFLTGIGDVKAIPPNQLEFTNVNTNSKFIVTLPMNMTQDQLDWIIKMWDKVVINDTTNDLEYLGVPINNIVFDSKVNFDNNEKKLYVDTDKNIVYRYNGTTYVQVGGMNKEVIEVVDTLKSNPTIDDLDSYCITRTNNKIYRCIYDVNTSKYVWSLTASDVPPSIELLDTLPLESTLTIDDFGRYVLSKDTDEIFKCIEAPDNLGTYIWKNINPKKDVIEVIDDISTITPSADTVGKVYFDKKDNNLYKGVEDLTVPSNPVYDFENVSSKGIQIVDDYSLLPVVIEDTICYCKTDYVDTSVTPNVEHKSGFYLWDNTASVWTLISSETKERYPEFIPSHNYVIGDTFRDGDTKYEVIKDFTSGATVADNDDSVMEVVETYYYLTKEKKADLETRGLVKESNIYIISNADDVQDRYSEEFTVASTDWNVQHSLGEQYPSKVYVFDDNGEEIFLPTIEFYSNNLLIVHFDIPVSGKVIVIK